MKSPMKSPPPLQDRTLPRTGAARSGPAAPTLQTTRQLANASPRTHPLQQHAALLADSARSVNRTGLPDQLKAGIESLSGMRMDHVRVHYNSAQPAQMQAHAYAQGSEIHVGPGQEKHLPHEAWHVVQQAQGRVRPTVQLHGGARVNDNAGLEREADVMGSRAARGGQSGAGLIPSQRAPGPATPVAQLTLADVTAAETLWQAYNAKHGVVNGHVQADIAAIRAAYAHYALAAHGGHNDATADAQNAFLRKSVAGLQHDVAEIDSHAGGYYYQQEVKAAQNVARNIANQQGAYGGSSNNTDPDVIVKNGPGGPLHAIEVKRTTGATQLDTMLNSALTQLSLRRGYSRAIANVEVTDAAQVATVIAHRADVNQTVSNTTRTLDGFARHYHAQAQAAPGGIWGPSIVLTVTIRSPAAVIYDRDFRVHLEQTVGRKSISYSVQNVVLQATRL